MEEISSNSIEVITLTSLAEEGIVYKADVEKRRTVYIHDIDSVSQVLSESGFVHTDRCGILIKDEKLVIKEDYFKIRDRVFRAHKGIGY